MFSKSADSNFLYKSLDKYIASRLSGKLNNVIQNCPVHVRDNWYTRSRLSLSADSFKQLGMNIDQAIFGSLKCYSLYLIVHFKSVIVRMISIEN